MQSVAEIFSQLSPEDEKILVSLPYRVGLYVSYADITGGWEAQEKEQQALIAILRQFSEDFYKTEFVQKVLMEALQRRSEWPSWAQDMIAVPQQAEHIGGVLSSMIFEQELESFREVLVDIAMSVAMAFRENGASKPGEGLESRPGGLREFIVRIIGASSRPDPLEHINISDKEKEALLRLADSLHYTKLGRS